MIKALIICQLLLIGIITSLFGQELPKVMFVNQKEILNKNIQGKITGQVIYRNTAEIIPFGKVELLDSLNKNLKIYYTQSEGKFHFDSITSGIYKIVFSLEKHMKHIITNIPISAFDSIFINFEITKPWSYETEINVCPNCKTNKKVIRIFNDSIPTSSNKRKKKFVIKQQRKALNKGYKTTRLADGEEVLIELYIENKAQKMKESGLDWFCKRCKIVF
jgi:5-hydroxyisourate hydrolase-like protein (transthyretin family)